eukprot:IDg10812t1
MENAEAVGTAEAPFAGRENEVAPLLQGPGGTYRGYKPIGAQDLPYAEDIESGIRSKKYEVDPAMLRDASHTSLRQTVLACFFGALFITFIIWQVLIAMCKIDHFCDLLERSSISKTIGNSPAIRIPV